MLNTDVKTWQDHNDLQMGVDYEAISVVTISKRMSLIEIQSAEI
jgi:hypothetical protein